VLLVREALKHVDLNYELIVYRDGEEMLNYLEKVEAGALPPPDIILLDLNLPRVTGDIVLERKRETAWCKDIPVIIVTSSNSPADRDKTARLGATAYFRKPADYDAFLELGTVVRSIVENR
jgi:CheY-like chemotaxis protein